MTLACHGPLYSGLAIWGGTHSPSSSSSQASGLLASGSAIVAGMSSQSSGLVSLGSSISGRSSQSSGFFASGSCTCVPSLLDGTTQHDGIPTWNN